MIERMASESHTHTLGPEHGRLEVETYREGLAQKVGHDLVLELTRWQATVELGADGAPSAVRFEADPRSLEVREGRNGLKPLSDADREKIKRNIEQDVLGTKPITFESNAVDAAGGITVLGELEIAGRRRPESFELVLSDAGRLSGRLRVVQSEFGIKPFRGLMGALKVRDEVEIVVDVQLPTGSGE
jgi:hypothetical protein